MKNFIKTNLRVLPTALLFSAISVYAAGAINAQNIGYCPKTNNMQAATVSNALDILYDRVDNVPVGTIMSYMGVSAPDNYLICDESVYNITDYQELADHIKTDFGSYNKFGGDGETTFAVPDLRGEFLRGAGTNSHENQGNGAAVGTHQDGTQHLRIGYNGTENAMFIPQVGNNDVVLRETKTDKTLISENTGYGKRFLSDSNWVSTEHNYYTSRPTNTSVNYIIKVK